MKCSKCEFHFCWHCMKKFGSGTKGGTDGYSQHKCNSAYHPVGDAAKKKEVCTTLGIGKVTSISELQHISLLSLGVRALSMVPSAMRQSRKKRCSGGQITGGMFSFHQISSWFTHILWGGFCFFLQQLDTVVFSLMTDFGFTMYATAFAHCSSS